MSHPLDPLTSVLAARYAVQREIGAAGMDARAVGGTGV